MRFYNFLFPLLLLFFSHGIFADDSISPKREFRAVWIATVNNIDWPSAPNLTAKQQKKEFINILESHKKQHINAVIVQIRPASDAFYKSKIEPWSKWLTGQQGKAPQPLYDPLKFMIAQCHQRAMEFHAWFNPFRLTTNRKKELATSHIAVQKPEWVVTFGNTKILNPGIPQARKYVQTVIADVLKRYDVDGIHFDDYFYPYPKKGLVFDDYNAFITFNPSGINQENWRRENINSFIKEVYTLIKKEKPYVKFGVSPFGIWRNKTQDANGSESGGMSAYDQIFVDSRKWLAEGWVDYIVPQIYWSMDFKVAPYKGLLAWWGNNASGKHIYSGNAIYKINNNYDTAWSNPSELPQQIRWSRELENVQGSVFFSSSKLLNNPNNLQDSLTENLYQNLSLSPTMKWKDSFAPESPQKIKTTYSNKGNLVKWSRSKQASDGDKASYYVLYRFEASDSIDAENSTKILSILPSKQKHFLDKKATSNRVYNYGITALDRLQNESALLTSFQRQSTTSKIKNIIVYPNLAQIRRETHVNLLSGETQLTFTQLSTKIKKETLHCSSDDEIVIKSIDYQIYKPFENNFKQQKDSLKRLLDLYNEYLLEKQTSLSILGVQQKELVAKNSIDKRTAISDRNLKRTREKLEKNWKELYRQTKKIKLETDSISLVKDSITNHLQKLEILQNKEAGRVIVTLFSKSPSLVKMQLDYAVSEVSWQPVFNFSTIAWGKSINLEYRLLYTQNTGVDWEDIPLRFTNKPSSKTFLNPKKNKKHIHLETAKKEAPTFKKSFFQQNKTIISPFADISFESPQTIFSDSTEQNLRLLNSRLNTSFEYLIDSEKSNTALTVARLPKWKMYQLTKGKMNLYLNNRYAGTSQLQPNIFADTLDIILGNDDEILVSRKKTKTQKIQKLIGFNSNYWRSYDLLIINNKKETVQLKIREQLPVNLDNRLKILPTIVDNGKYNSTTGIISWQIELKAGEQRKISYSYILKHLKWLKINHE